jgi:thioredoxin 1
MGVELPAIRSHICDRTRNKPGQPHSRSSSEAPRAERAIALKEPLMATVKVTDESFDADVLKASTPVLVDFWAEWCGPCKQIGPALEQIADELGGQVTVAKVNIDDSPMTPSKLGVKGIPTLMLFKDGQMTSMKVGAMPKGKIVEWLAEAGVKAQA